MRLPRTSAGILREGREMGSMRSGIPKTVQGAHRVATVRGAGEKAVRPDAPGSEAHRTAPSPTPGTRQWGYGEGHPVPPPQPITRHPSPAARSPTQRVLSAPPPLRVQDRPPRAPIRFIATAAPTAWRLQTQGRVRRWTQASDRSSSSQVVAPPTGSAVGSLQEAFFSFSLYF